MNYKNILAVAFLVAVIGVFSLLQSKPWQVYGNVGVEDVLESTTTPQVADLAVLCVGPGMLGSVHALTTGTGGLTLHDATTSNATYRIGGKKVATSTTYLADFKAGFGTTTNNFNTRFNYGLLVDYGTGVPTSTITYRCGS